MIDGVDYSSLYSADPNNGYVQKVVQQFGTAINVNGDQYLEFAFSQNGTTSTEFQSTESFRSTGSLFYSTSMYAGIGGGISLDVFGLGLGFQTSFYMMRGIEFESSLQHSSGSDSTWGVDLSNYLNVLSEGDSYTARLYLLKPSKLWSVELQMFSTLSGMTEGTQADLVNSAPVRILFTVPTSNGLD